MSEEQLLEYLPPMQDKKAVFAIGRFQPPTAGHYKVFDKMKKYIREHPEMDLTPIIVIVAGEKSSLDKTKNPLSVDERTNFLEASGRCNGFKIYSAKNGKFALGKIRDNGYEPIVLAAGSDRAEGYLKNLKDFTTPDGEPIEHIVLPGLDRIEAAVATKKNEKEKNMNDMIDRLKDGEDINDEEVSGSLARKVAEMGYLEEFISIVGLENKPALAKMLYHKIRKAIGVE